MTGFVDGLEMGNNTKVYENNSFKFISLGCVCLFQTLLLCELLGCNNENWSQRDESLFQVVVFIC